MRKQVLLPKYKNGLSQMGENIKLARKRRKLTAIQVAERAGISRSTLSLIEKNQVMSVFKEAKDFLELTEEPKVFKKEENDK